MTLTLSAQHEGFVRDKVKAGSYSNEEEVIGAALKLLQKQDGEYERQLAWLQDAIEQGCQSARAGNLFTPEEVWADLAERKRQRSADRSRA